VGEKLTWRGGRRAVHWHQPYYGSEEEEYAQVVLLPPASSVNENLHAFGGPFLHSLARLIIFMLVLVLEPVPSKACVRACNANVRQKIKKKILCFSL
jgi:hypothetical protein